MAELSSSRSDSPSGPNGTSVFPALPAFFTSNVLDGGTLARVGNTGLAFAEPDDDRRIAAFNTSALHVTTYRQSMSTHYEDIIIIIIIIIEIMLEAYKHIHTSKKVKKLKKLKTHKVNT